jgi:hypothetical protein
MASLSPYADPDGKLRQIPVALLSNEIEDSLQCSYVWYNGKRIAGRSDGDKLEIFYDRKSNEWFDQPRVTEWNPKYLEQTDAKGNKLFKMHTTLNVVIASPEARWGGFYKFRTTSQISANQLYGSLLHFRELTYGMLRGMPFRLIVRPLQVAPGGKTTTVYVVHLELVASDLQAIQQQAIDRSRFELENQKTLRAQQSEYKKLLALPGYTEAAIEHEEIAEEFHPEQLAEGEVPNEPIAGPDPLAAQFGKQPSPVVVVEANPPTVVADDVHPDEDFDDEPEDFPEDGELFKPDPAVLNEQKSQLDATK